jgi:hypothetical protein
MVTGVVRVSRKTDCQESGKAHLTEHRNPPRALGTNTAGTIARAPQARDARDRFALRAMGCDLAQGFLYGRPSPHEVFLD